MCRLHIYMRPQETSIYGLTSELLIPSQIHGGMGQPFPNLLRWYAGEKNLSCLNCFLQGRASVSFLVSFAFLQWAHKSFSHDLQKILPSSLDSSKLVNTHVHFCINDESL